MSISRMLFFLFINMVLSALIALAILKWQEAPPTAGNLPNTAVVVQTTAPSIPTGTLTAREQGAISEIHVVQSGDTLQNMERLYGVSIDEIQRANQLPNSILSIGQELIIPYDGYFEQLNQLPTKEIVTGTSVLEFSGIVANGDIKSELLKISNLGDTAVNLNKWHIKLTNGKIYWFPDFTLFPEGSVQIYTQAGENTGSNLFWGETTAILQSGEQAQLYDMDGNVHHTIQVQ